MELAYLISYSHSYNGIGLTTFDSYVQLLKGAEELKEKVIDMEVRVAEIINIKQSAQEVTDLNDDLDQAN